MRLLVQLQFANPFDDFYSVEAYFNPKVLLEIRLSHVVNDLSIHANFFELFAILGQLDLLTEPLGDISGVPLVIVTFEFRFLHYNF